MQVDRLVEKQLRADGCKGEDHHCEVPRADVQCCHGDYVHYDSDAHAEQDEWVDGVSGVGVVHESIINGSREDIRRGS